MKRFLKGCGHWMIFNGLYGWAVWSACIMLSPIGYNFLLWSTSVLMVIQLMSFFGMGMIKTSDPDKYNKIRDDYNNGWRINIIVDILYSLVVLAAMLYGGFLGIATMYLINEFVQFSLKDTLKVVNTPTSEEIVSQYDDSILERLGVDRNERGW